jgi:hypothetical protein
METAMNTRNITATCLTAAITFSVLMCLPGAVPLFATPQEKAVPPKSIIDSKQAHVELLRMVPSDDKSKPFIRVVVRNKTDKPLELPIQVSAVKPAPPASPMSRMMSISISIWNDKRTVTVAPGKTTTIDFTQAAEATSQFTLLVGKQITGLAPASAPAALKLVAPLQAPVQGVQK